jgi:hypothetical protein
MAKQSNAPKAKKRDIVVHNGERWTVLDRKFDTSRGQSFYLLKTGRRGTSTHREKWARSDTFSV